MDKRFIVIHPSEIIRQGLLGILQQFYNAEILLLESEEKLESFTSFSNLHIILLTDCNLEANDLKRYFSQMQENKNMVSCIGIGDVECEYCDSYISLNDPGIELQKKITSLSKKLPIQKELASELSERERDVLRLVALGHANKEIANELYISIHTVISHRKNITEKLGIKSISGLTVYAILNGLIDTKTIDPATLI